MLLNRLFVHTRESKVKRTKHHFFSFFTPLFALDTYFK